MAPSLPSLSQRLRSRVDHLVGTALQSWADASSRAHEQLAEQRRLRRPTLARLSRFEDNDGLTDSERLESLVRFRRTVGLKPSTTGDHAARAEVVAEKLAGLSYAPPPSRRNA